MAKRIEQTLELWNIADEAMVHSGAIAPITVTAKADNGSSYTILPRQLADRLKLPKGDKVWVKYADERRAKRQLVIGLRIRVPGIPGRVVTTDALVEPKRTTVLLGCEEMERMDLLADHRAGALLPRPGTERGITAEVE